MIVPEYQNTKASLLKDTLETSQKKFLFLAKLKIQFPGLILLATPVVNRLLEAFMKKIAKTKKVTNCLLNGKVMIVVLIVGLIKK